jgi:hypothetical protein
MQFKMEEDGLVERPIFVDAKFHISGKLKGYAVLSGEPSNHIYRSSRNVTLQMPRFSVRCPARK